MMKWLLSIFMLLMPNLFANENVLSIDFNSLSDQQQVRLMDGKKVKIRGFLYFKEGSWILAATPNLTCCIGTNGKAHRQIHLK